MVIETLDQMRARLDQLGVTSEDVDFVVALAAQMDTHPWLLPLSLMALAEASVRQGCYQTAKQLVRTHKHFYEEIEHV